MFGGALPKIPDLVPSDIEVLRNHLYKPLHWRQSDPSYEGIRWSVKNLFELKTGRNVTVEGNIMENQWGDTNSTYGAVNLTASAQDSGPKAALQHITFRNNIVRHVGVGVRLSGLSPEHYPTEPCFDLKIFNNVFDDVDGARWHHDGIWLLFPDKFQDLKIQHNTVLQAFTTILVGDATVDNNISYGFEMTDNIVKHAGYGIYGVDHIEPAEAIGYYFPGAVFRRNVIIGGDPSKYSTFSDNSSPTYFPASVAAVGFANLTLWNYRLSGGSPFKATATDGKDIGVDQNALEAAIAGVASNLRAAPPTGLTYTPAEGVFTFERGYLSWSDNSDAEVGYTLEYRDVTPPNVRYTPVRDWQTAARLGANSTIYPITALHKEMEYRVKAIFPNGSSDYSNAPHLSSGCYIQPKTICTFPSGGGLNAKINFQTASSAVPAGYLPDSGGVYGDRGNGYAYGWDLAWAQTRDRDSSNSPDQRYDTFLMMHDGGPYTWEMSVPNGTYSVRVVAGDAEYLNSVYKIDVEGVLTVDGIPTGANRWVEGTRTVIVSDGRLTISNAAGSSNNKICFVEITYVPPPERFSAKVNFQPSAALTPAGYLADSASLYGDRGNGYTYGWDLAWAQTRDRDSANSPDQRYDTFLMMHDGGPYTWEIAVPNGSYTVRAVAGDAEYLNSVYKINVEGVLTVDGTPTGANRWVEGTRTVTVSDGKLTVSNAAGSNNNKLCFIEISQN
jgi:hypothetical protein